ncbi:hypothetical protein OG739_36580 [Streptomyces longwoodensis]|uniref:hypothetical protein n=1 Tax=Streptomyces longwoodensis TaxID=68231 RepID=UPI00131C6769|nr:hypothetical protein [Streptomyces longwoodensis]MCX5000805.1 hypothetical protein [Streptomyces longwoodensis]WUC55693.1 hypothetical protein OHA09_00610 [Streptomyces longwoodensis]WUC62187.1 hypothetical protein OHA09_36360 [Streptomyces longwoodensis]
MNSVNTDQAVETSQDDLREQVAHLHGRLHLTDVRVQRLRAESLGDPPFDVNSIQIHSGPCEVLLEPPRFAARVNQTVTLRDLDEQTLAEVEIVLIIDYALDEGPDLPEDVVSAYVEHNTYFTAHPYLRETLQNATLRLGLEPVILGVLDRNQPRPHEVMLVRRAPARSDEASQ